MKSLKVIAAMALVIQPLSILAAAADAIPDQTTIERMHTTAVGDNPAAYIDTLINCAAYHGVVAIRSEKESGSDEGHDDLAIMLLTAANFVPPRDTAAVDTAYTNKLLAFTADLAGDKSGEVETELAKLGAICLTVEEYAGATVLMAKAEADAASDNSDTIPALIDEEQKIVDTIFAPGTDGPSAYGSMLLNCAAYHGTVAARAKPKKGAADKEKELIFLAAAVALSPGKKDRIRNDHATDLLRYRQVLDGDTTGQMKREQATMKTDCAKLQPIAEKRIELAKDADT